MSSHYFPLVLQASFTSHLVHFGYSNRKPNPQKSKLAWFCNFIVLQFPGATHYIWHLSRKYIANICFTKTNHTSHASLCIHKLVYIFISCSLRIALCTTVLWCMTQPSIRLRLLYVVKNQGASYALNLVTKNVLSGLVRMRTQKKEPLQNCFVVVDLCPQKHPVT